MKWIMLIYSFFSMFSSDKTGKEKFNLNELTFFKYAWMWITLILRVIFLKG
jgi:hypothetical protein